MLVKKYSYSYYSKASTYIVQYYLQGRRYVYSSPQLPVSLPPFPVTPTNRQHRIQNWASSSSSISSTPSFSGSDSTDYSSEADDESMPSTPSTSANSSVVLDPFTFHAMSIGSTVATTTSLSNKENLPVVSGGMPGMPVVVRDGVRSRKSSLEGLDAGVMDLCQPSPASRDATTYIPRAALHSLTPNNRANGSQGSLI